MQLLTLLLSLAFLRLWDGRNPVQQDGWYRRWLARLRGHSLLQQRATLRFVLAVGVPVIAAVLVMDLLGSLSSWLALPVYIMVLLYSFGRQPITEPLQTYLSASACDNWSLAVQQANALGVPKWQGTSPAWENLDQQVLEAATYREFERFFAVVFWFLLLGPVGALIYRLSWLYVAQRAGCTVAKRCLWAMEWPAARVLGFSFSVTGNFVGSMRRWKDSFLNTHQSSAQVLADVARGALVTDEDIALQPTAVARQELTGLIGLYRRTRWFWLLVWGVWVILF